MAIDAWLNGWLAGCDAGGLGSNLSGNVAKDKDWLPCVECPADAETFAIMRPWMAVSLNLPE